MREAMRKERTGSNFEKEGHPSKHAELPHCDPIISPNSEINCDLNKTILEEGYEEG